MHKNNTEPTIQAINQVFDTIPPNIIELAKKDLIQGFNDGKALNELGKYKDNNRYLRLECCKQLYLTAFFELEVVEMFSRFKEEM